MANARHLVGLYEISILSKTDQKYVTTRKRSHGESNLSLRNAFRQYPPCLILLFGNVVT